MATNDQHVDCSRATWRKSTRSSGNGECVEIATSAETVAIRDSKDPDGPKLTITRPAWAAFIHRVKDGRSGL
ncbi:MAG TPA: DUF397 domain-containing protein [Streptosporangiaceae bacterium]|jgi:hypothetical protein